jgi:hypothetical protein
MQTPILKYIDLTFRSMYFISRDNSNPHTDNSPGLIRNILPVQARFNMGLRRGCSPGNSDIYQKDEREYF